MPERYATSRVSPVGSGGGPLRVGSVPEIRELSASRTAIDDLWVISMKEVTDERGTVREFYRESAFRDAGLPSLGPWVQVNVTETRGRPAGTARRGHVQAGGGGGGRGVRRLPRHPATRPPTARWSPCGSPGARRSWCRGGWATGSSGEPRAHPVPLLLRPRVGPRHGGHRSTRSTRRLASTGRCRSTPPTRRRSPPRTRPSHRWPTAGLTRGVHGGGGSERRPAPGHHVAARPARQVEPPGLRRGRTQGVGGGAVVHVERRHRPVVEGDVHPVEAPVVSRSRTRPSGRTSGGSATASV